MGIYIELYKSIWNAQGKGDRRNKKEGRHKGTKGTVLCRTEPVSVVI